ncbi:monooxygenase [Mycobacterium tuberculosis]|uniref:Monooxygenase n=1 Tax=Mycobacterium tuberculosis TaxID=1773 RepID=A0A655JBP6_MYCTX|nr:monooxygenase [Mycobacterium tuberculosis]
MWIGGEGDRVQRIAAKHAQGLNVRWCVERIREYQDRGVGHFLFTIPHVVKSDYLHIIGSDIIPRVKTEVTIP